MFSELDRAFMQEAIELAKEAELNDEVPVGAVITLDNKIIKQASKDELQIQKQTRSRQTGGSI